MTHCIRVTFFPLLMQIEAATGVRCRCGLVFGSKFSSPAVFCLSSILIDQGFKFNAKGSNALKISTYFSTFSRLCLT